MPFALAVNEHTDHLKWTADAQVCCNASCLL